jgi:hypothetical protein
MGEVSRRYVQWRMKFHDILYFRARQQTLSCYIFDKPPYRFSNSGVNLLEQPRHTGALGSVDFITTLFLYVYHIS